MQNLKILIVGGGVAGLTCAALLKNHGLQPEIIERESEENFNKSGLNLYMNRQKGKVEKAQKSSRQFGRLMFINSPIVAEIRNKLMTFYSNHRLMSDLSWFME
jgi:2-polyprenyl-6-methoxyphenol hydroxylase-like FAD-dependent oxidoreductase